MSVIQPAQTNLVLDPAFAKAETERAFGPQIKIAREIVGESVALFQRAFSSSKRDLSDLVVIGVLYRQVVAMFDSAVLNLENGACYAALVPIRAMWEAGLSIEWMLKRGKDQYARQFYVAFVRSQRSWASNLIPGSPEHAALQEARRLSGKQPATDPPAEKVASARETVSGADEILASDKNRDINAKFENLNLKAGRDAAWTKPDPGSIYGLAKELGHLDEYQELYRFLSYPTHGGLMNTHLEFKGVDVNIEHIRSPEDFTIAFNLGVTFGLRSYLQIQDEYRRGEAADFGKRYIERWQQAFRNVPGITIPIEYVRMS